jgi:hypothetical protein
MEDKMARISANLTSKLASPTLEVFRGGKHSTTTVGTTATAVPATNLSNRKAASLQNLHASNLVYVAVESPEIILIPKGLPEFKPEGEVISGTWHLSANGTNEWFFASSAKATTGMTQPVILYSATSGGSETVRTNGTVSSLVAEHGWGWGDGDTLGFSTLYIRTAGSTELYRPERVYQSILGYSNMPDTSSTYGIYLGPKDSVTFTVDGSARIFAIASGASTPVSVQELI